MKKIIGVIMYPFDQDITERTREGLLSVKESLYLYINVCCHYLKSVDIKADLTDLSKKAKGEVKEILQNSKSPLSECLMQAKTKIEETFSTGIKSITAKEHSIEGSIHKICDIIACKQIDEANIKEDADKRIINEKEKDLDKYNEALSLSRFDKNVKLPQIRCPKEIILQLSAVKQEQLEKISDELGVINNKYLNKLRGYDEAVVFAKTLDQSKIDLAKIKSGLEAMHTEVQLFRSNFHAKYIQYQIKNCKNIRTQTIWEEVVKEKQARKELAG